MLKKIFPSMVASSPLDSFKIILLAEGFQVTQKQEFSNACYEFIERLTTTPPFNLIKLNPNLFNIYSGFKASNQSGPGNNSTTPARTVFESVFNATQKTLTINQAKFNAFIENPSTTFPYDNNSLALNEFYAKGNISLSKFATIIAILLPPIAGETKTIETESVLSKDDYHFIGTTTNNHWYQVIFRTIGSKMGLGDESENPGTEFQAPTQGKDDANSFNLQYLDALPETNRDKRLKWSKFFSAAQRILPPSVHPKTGDTSIPDNSINALGTTQSKIEFWEGGGGFRTGIYRSAMDCLMRRRIGDLQLPVSDNKVPFCYVCRNYLKALLE